MLTHTPKQWQPHGVESLEPTADKVVRSLSNCLVLAGPGAGKSELLAQKACFLLETGTCKHPKRILALSFKRDAAKNLRDRVEKRCGENAKRFESMTIDAFGKSLVDRFLSGIPSDWRPKPGFEVMVNLPDQQEIRRWLMAAPVPDGRSRLKFETMSNQKLKKGIEQCIYGYPLPYCLANDHYWAEFYGKRWWNECLQRPTEQPSLMFPMLNRLAAYMLRSNPIIKRSLTSTYSHVFLDEFQDTTSSQYDLIRTSFIDSECILTAVGDSKQRIMLFAGAMREVFDQFICDFNATKSELTRNYRSARELVQIQHVIASSIETETLPVESAHPNNSKGFAYIAEFSSSEQEAEYLTDLIHYDISEKRLNPRDICIIVRQKPSEMTAILKNRLRVRGIKMRDESELQDLLSEPICDFVLPVLKLATCKRDPGAWELLNQCLSLIDLEYPFDELNESQQEANEIVRYVRKLINGDNLSIRDLPLMIVNRIGPDKLRGYYRQYSNANYLRERLSLLGKYLESSNADTLIGAVDELYSMPQSMTHSHLVPFSV